MAKKKRGSIPTTPPKEKSNIIGTFSKEQQRLWRKANDRATQIQSGINAASGTGAHKVKATDIKRNRQADRKLAQRFKRGDFDGSHHPAL